MHSITVGIFSGFAILSLGIYMIIPGASTVPAIYDYFHSNGPLKPPSHHTGSSPVPSVEIWAELEPDAILPDPGPATIAASATPTFSFSFSSTHLQAGEALLSESAENVTEATQQLSPQPSSHRNPFAIAFKIFEPGILIYHRILFVLPWLSCLALLIVAKASEVRDSTKDELTTRAAATLKLRKEKESAEKQRDSALVKVLKIKEDYDEYKETETGMNKMHQEMETTIKKLRQEWEDQEKMVHLAVENTLKIKAEFEEYRKNSKRVLRKYETERKKAEKGRDVARDSESKMVNQFEKCERDTKESMQKLGDEKIKTEMERDMAVESSVKIGNQFELSKKDKERMQSFAIERKKIEDERDRALEAGRKMEDEFEEHRRDVKAAMENMADERKNVEEERDKALDRLRKHMESKKKDKKGGELESLKEENEAAKALIEELRAMIREKP